MAMLLFAGTFLWLGVIFPGATTERVGTLVIPALVITGRGRLTDVGTMSGRRLAIDFLVVPTKLRARRLALQFGHFIFGIDYIGGRSDILSVALPHSWLVSASIVNVDSNKTRLHIAWSYNHRLDFSLGRSLVLELSASCELCSISLAWQLDWRCTWSRVGHYLTTTMAKVVYNTAGRVFWLAYESLPSSGQHGGAMAVLLVAPLLDFVECLNFLMSASTSRIRRSTSFVW